jgi:hypothetical protein
VLSYSVEESEREREQQTTKERIQDELIIITLCKCLYYITLYCHVDKRFSWSPEKRNQHVSIILFHCASLYAIIAHVTLQHESH